MTLRRIDEDNKPMLKQGLRLRMLMVGAVLLMSGLWLQAQEAPATPAPLSPAQEAQLITPLMDDGGALMVSFPPPVYTLGGVVEVRGRVNLTDLQSYFLEFRPLIIEPDETPEEALARPWFPASLPTNVPVTAEAIIGQWNTSGIPDGLYELRLVALNLAGERQVMRVSPLRVANDLPDFLVTPTIDRPPLLATPTPLAGGASNTGTGNANQDTTTSATQPRVTALVDANVRRGDDTRYDRVSFLLRGESADIIGVSSFGSGWFYIETSDGLRGFIAPNTVSVAGNIGGLPLINPPPPPTPIATATPLATATPTTSANLLISGQQLIPAVPVCNETFEIRVNVTNNGTTPTTGSASVSVVDRHVASGTVTQTTVGAVPILQPGQNFVSVMYLTVDTYYAEAHRLSITVNPDGVVPETNTADNTVTIDYTLAQGACS